MHCCFDAPVKRMVWKELGHATSQERRLQGKGLSCCPRRLSWQKV